MESRKNFRRLRLSMLAAVLVAPWMFAAPPAATTSAERASVPPTQQRSETVIFVVSGTEDDEGASSRAFSMDALVVIRGGKYISPVNGEDEKSERLFADKYYGQGQQYHVLYGGGRAGTATVQSWAKGCNAIHAKTSVQLNRKLPGGVSALASNSERLGKKEGARRELTKTERAAVMTLVKNIYRRNRTGPSLMAKLETGRLAATDLDGDGKYEIIGDFKIQSGSVVSGARRDLFLIATPEGKGYRAELAEFQSYRMDSGFGRGSSFADQLDIDGDGIAEVISVDEGFDAYGYSIYKKQGGRWRSIYSVAGDAC